MAKDIHVTPRSGGGFHTDSSGTHATPQGSDIVVSGRGSDIRVSPTAGGGFHTDTSGVHATTDGRGGFYLESAGSAAAAEAGYAILALIVLAVLIAPIALWFYLLSKTIDNRKAGKKGTGHEAAFAVLTALYTTIILLVGLPILSQMITNTQKERQFLVARDKELAWAIANPNSAITIKRIDEYESRDGNLIGVYELTNNTNLLGFGAQADVIEDSPFLFWHACTKTSVYPQGTDRISCLEKDPQKRVRSFQQFCFIGHFFSPPLWYVLETDLPPDRWVGEWKEIPSQVQVCFPNPNY